MLIISSFVARNSLDTNINSAELLYNHAYSYIENQLETLVYVSDHIRQNGLLQRILTSSDFHGNRPEDVLYREFLQLDAVFNSAEATGSIYQAKIYITPDIGYTNNIRHISHISEIENTEDYARFLETDLISKVYFADPKTVFLPGDTQPLDVLPLLFFIRKTDGSFIHIAVGEVNMLVSKIQSILSNLNTLENSVTLIYNTRGKTISTNLSNSDKQFDINNLRSLGRSTKWQKTEVSGIKYYYYQSSFPLADWFMITLIPERDMLIQSRQWQAILLILIAVEIIVVFFMAYTIANYYIRRLNQLQMAMMQVQQGNLNATFNNNYNDEIGQLAQSFEQMTYQLKNSLNQRYLSIKAARNAEFRALQAQINPHILYNTLDLINWEALEYGAPEIANMARSLAQFFRSSLNKGQQVITLSEEINQVRSYVEVENYHFNNVIRLIVQIDEKLLAYACIPLILQPLVENSILHGCIKRSNLLKYQITITGKCEHECLTLKVSDDGAEAYSNPLTSKQGEGYGTKNLDLRLKLCFGNKYGLSYQTQNGRTIAVIKMPAYTLEEAREKVDMSTKNFIIDTPEA